MEISIKTAIIFLAILLTGLSAGLFYAWEVSVIPGTKKISDKAYLEIMQTINRAILNPAFFIIFFGSLIFLIAGTYMQFKAGVNMAFGFMLTAALTYLIGTFGVTAFGNVPLNNWLETLPLAELDATQIIESRKSYEIKWNQWHTLRTVCSVVSFGSSILSQFLNQ